MSEAELYENSFVDIKRAVKAVSSSSYCTTIWLYEACILRIALGPALVRNLVQKREQLLPQVTITVAGRNR